MAYRREDRISMATATEELFGKVLAKFADSDNFSRPTSCSIFIVYAHDNPEQGTAHASIVRYLIRWLGNIRSRVISDKAPLVHWSPREDGVASIHDILSNQLCLLPYRSRPNGSIVSVDKIIICDSEVLSRYHTQFNHSSSSFAKDIATVYSKLRNKREDLQKELRTVVEKYSGRDGFHHVLTELAFTKLRCDGRKNYEIIPVALDGDIKRTKSLLGLSPHDVVLHVESSQATDFHDLFFKLLERLYTTDWERVMIHEYQDFYKRSLDILSSKTVIWRREFGDILHSEMVKASENLSNYHSVTLRTKVPTKRHFKVPFDRNENFIGREEILSRVLSRIPPSINRDACLRTAIEGLGGIGKTQIALEAAYRVHENYADCSVFWVPAVDATTFENAYREIGQQLETPGIKDDKADIKKLIKAALSQEGAGDWLLIIDNADDQDLLFGDTALSDHLPSSRRGSILFTTRNHAAAVNLDIPGQGIITAVELSRNESLDLLARDLKKSQTDDSKSTDTLMEFLADLPLAIKQASAYMAKTSISTAKYLSYCQSSNRTLIQLLSQNFSDQGRYKELQNPITTTWLISFDHIMRDAPLAAQYLRFICFLADKDVPRSLLPPGDNELQEDEAIGTLKAYAFITERKTSNSFDIHQLVRVIMRNWLSEKEERAIWVTKVIQRLENIFPWPKHVNKGVWIEFLPHAQAAVELRKECTNEESKISLLLRLGDACNILGKYEQAEQIRRETLELKEKVLGREHPDTLASMNNLALVLQSQGKYKEAEQMHREILELREKVLGREHPDTLASMNNLALVLQSQGKYEEAKQMHRKTLELWEKVLGREHPDTLANMNNLALVLQSQGKYKEAEQMHRETLELREKVLGREHPNTLDSINNLALVQESQGKYKEAEQMHRETLELWEKLLGREHPDTLASMNNLAGVLQSQGKYEEAEQMHRETLELREKVLGREHPDTLASMNNLAGVLRSQGKYEEAEQMHRETLELREKVLGREHPNTLDSINNLALVQESQGKYEEADQMRRMRFGESVPAAIKGAKALMNPAIRAVTQADRVEGGFWRKLRCW